MDPQLLDGYLTPLLIPTIMVSNLVKLVRIEELDLLYATVTLGTVLSTISSLLQHRIRRRFSRSRSKLTLYTAILLTTASILAIIGFHTIRVNIPAKLYKLPNLIRRQKASNSNEVFRYHFFADFIPGFIILTQTQLCSSINFELLNRAKRTFSAGEASILAQLASASFLTWSLITYSAATGAGPFQVNLTMNIALNIGVIVYSLVFLPSYLITWFWNRSRRTLVRYSLLVLGFASVYIRVKSLVEEEPFRWFVNYVFLNHHRISLFCVWTSTLAACISFSTNWASAGATTNSLVRKIFHLAVGVVFVTGYKQDLEFTRFAAAGVLVVMFLFELIRAWQLKPIGAQLERVCQALRGKWDNKYLTLSHMYLLVGVFVPLWILPNNSKITNKLMLSTGLISVGVGDTAAAVVGTFLGRTKFRGESGKTLEGLAGNIVAMILFKLFWIGYVDFISEFSFILAAILTALIESLTINCDNLNLPLVMILFLEIF